MLKFCSAAILPLSSLAKLLQRCQPTTIIHVGANQPEQVSEKCTDPLTVDRVDRGQRSGQVQTYGSKSSRRFSLKVSASRTWR